MTTEFVKLNHDWNAQPNAPKISISITGADLHLEFGPNSYAFPEYESVSKIVLTFQNCWRYRIGIIGDESWYRGQCRFSDSAPEWGEFFEVRGDLKLEELEDWTILSSTNDNSNHYLFYFRDQEFECDASSWTKQNIA